MHGFGQASALVDEHRYPTYIPAGVAGADHREVQRSQTHVGCHQSHGRMAQSKTSNFFDSLICKLFVDSFCRQRGRTGKGVVFTTNLIHDLGSIRTLATLFSFLGCSYKDIQQIQKDIPLKKFLETLSLFFHPEFPENGRGLPKLKMSCAVTGRVNI